MKNLTACQNSGIRFLKSRKQQIVQSLKKRSLLYVILTEGGTPIWVKTAIVSCLGYLIFPLDAYFDFLPFGYTDDLAMMGVLLVELTVFVTPAIEQRVADYLPEMCS